jgi:hypothetical protein
VRVGTYTVIIGLGLLTVRTSAKECRSGRRSIVVGVEQQGLKFVGPRIRRVRDAPQVRISSNGTIYVAWSAGEFGGTQVHLRRRRVVSTV